DDIAIVNKILIASTYYGVLNIDATFLSQPNGKSQLKKIFHKLALRVHPDKNFAPRSGEAFAKLNTAYNHFMNDTIGMPYVIPVYRPPPPTANAAAFAAAAASSVMKKCTAKTMKGVQCKKTARGGSTYCHTHKDFNQTADKPKPAPTAKVRCSATTKKGEQCLKFAIGSGTFCNVHQKK
ncbi:MAG: J domain-containing protein, partial [Candidatus Roizmanbacteria bacterium]